jgi:hypothetical protein
MLPAQVKVRLQARGGKILGPAVQQPLLTVKNLTRKEIPITDEKFNQESSGTVVSSFEDGVSRNAIVVEPPKISPTYPTPGPYWLQPPVGQEQGQGELIVQLYLDEPTQLEFIATAYAPYPVYSSATLWVLPEMQLLDDPGLVLTIEGLYTTVTASAAGGTVSIDATVKMMCGCPITPQPPLPPPSPPPPAGTEMFWPSSEFNVMAQIRLKNSSTDWTPVPLSCSGVSTFSGSVDKQPPGTYDVWLVAVQAKETNVGFAKTQVTVGT